MALRWNSFGGNKPRWSSGLLARCSTIGSSLTRVGFSKGLFFSYSSAHVPLHRGGTLKYYAIGTLCAFAPYPLSLSLSGALSIILTSSLVSHPMLLFNGMSLVLVGMLWDEGGVGVADDVDGKDDGDDARTLGNDSMALTSWHIHS